MRIHWSKVVLLFTVTQMALTVCGEESLRFRFSNKELVSTFVDLGQRSVFNMEPDSVLQGNILFSHKLFLKTTDGQSTKVVADFTSLQSSKKCSIPYPTITGTLQLSQDEIVVSFYCDHCLRLFNRVTNKTTPFAGQCYKEGYVNGVANAKFSHPSKILRDMKNQASLLVLDESNQALRQVYMLGFSPHKVTTLTKSSNMIQPSRMVQDEPTGDVFITSRNRVYRFAYASKVLFLLAGTTNWQHIDGPFSAASFQSPRDILLIDGGKKLLVAGDHSHSLRVLDLITNMTSSFCGPNRGHTNGNLLECSLTNPYSLLIMNDTLYVGEVGRIRKIQDSRVLACQVQEITRVASPETGFASVQLPTSDISEMTKFPPGEYKVDIRSERVNCTIKVSVKDHQLNRRLVLRARYPIVCSSLNSPIARTSLDTVATQHFNHVADICLQYCSKPEDTAVEMSCANDTLEVIWATDKTFAGAITKLPEYLKANLTPGLIKFGDRFALFMISQTPPVVYPNRQTDGSYLEAVLVSDCSGGLGYNALTDSCQKSCL